MGGEFGRVKSKMGEAWSDGGHPLLGLDLPAAGYCSAEITMIPLSPCTAVQSSHLQCYLLQIPH